MKAWGFHFRAVFGAYGRFNASPMPVLGFTWVGSCLAGTIDLAAEVRIEM